MGRQFRSLIYNIKKQSTEKNNLQTFVNLVHIMLDGQSEWIEGLRITEEALRQLSDEGKAEQISKDEWEKHPVESELSAESELTAEQKAFFWFFDNTSPKQISEDKWRIPPPCQQILGEGKSWVYLYYFDKEKAKAQDQRNEVWPCKIGLTQKDPEKRIQQQLEEDSDIPIIALLLRTDEPELLEKTIHGFLRLHGRHIEGDIRGREWFRTNPEEVVSIYKLITDWEHQITL